MNRNQSSFKAMAVILMLVAMGMGNIRASDSQAGADPGQAARLGSTGSDQEATPRLNLDRIQIGTSATRLPGATPSSQEPGELPDAGAAQLSLEQAAGAEDDEQPKKKGGKGALIAGIFALLLGAGVLAGTLSGDLK